MQNPPLLQKLEKVVASLRQLYTYVVASVSADRMEESSYNYWSTTPDGSSLLYNGRTCSLLLISPEELNDVKQTLNDAQGPYQEILFKNGFLVDNKSSEIKEVLGRRNTETSVLEITVSLTYQCNFRCEYCYVNFENYVIDKETIDLISTYLESVSTNYSEINITWFGGEPLLCIDLLLYAIRKINARCNNVRINHFVTTNGYLLDENVTEALFNEGVKFFHITIDGSKVYHDKHRMLINGDGTYDKIYSNMVNLVSKYPVNCTLRMNLEEDSIDSAYELISNIPDNLRRKIQFHPTAVIRSEQSVSPKFYSKLGELIEYSISLGYGYYDDILSRNVRAHCSAEYPGTVHFGPDGSLHRCSPSFKPEVTFGNLRSGTNSVHLENIKKWNAAKDVSDSCTRCPYLVLCQGGCRLNRIRGTKDDQCRNKYAMIPNHIRIKWLLHSEK